MRIDIKANYHYFIFLELIYLLHQLHSFCKASLIYSYYLLPQYLFASSIQKKFRSIILSSSSFTFDFASSFYNSKCSASVWYFVFFFIQTRKLFLPFMSEIDWDFLNISQNLVLSLNSNFEIYIYFLSFQIPFYQ